MRALYITLFTICLLIASGAQAQFKLRIFEPSSEFREGYMVTVENDTLYGTLALKIAEKERWENILYRDSEGVTKQFTAQQVRAFSQFNKETNEPIHFVSIATQKDEYHFYQRIVNLEFRVYGKRIKKNKQYLIIEKDGYFKKADKWIADDLMNHDKGLIETEDLLTYYDLNFDVK